jgi:hypothetical protein
MVGRGLTARKPISGGLDHPPSTVDPHGASSLSCPSAA